MSSGRSTTRSRGGAPSSVASVSTSPSVPNYRNLEKEVEESIALPQLKKRNGGKNNETNSGKRKQKEEHDSDENDHFNLDDSLIEAAAILQDLYRTNFLNSIESIVSSLTQEVPRDHLLRQLLADSSTDQYVKVRLVEIVESFLYSTQAESYHSLSLQLAQKEKEIADMSHHLDEFSRTLEHVSAPKVVLNKGCQVGSSDVFTETNCLSDSNGVSNPTRAMNATIDNTPNNNPMEEEAARMELLAILEETARERELERSREALEPTRHFIRSVKERLGELEEVDTRGQGNLPQRYAQSQLNPMVEDISDADEKMKAELGSLSYSLQSVFKAMNELVHYVDDTLDSLDALRNDLDRNSDYVNSHNRTSSNNSNNNFRRTGQEVGTALSVNDHVKPVNNSSLISALSPINSLMGTPSKHADTNAQRNGGGSDPQKMVQRERRNCREVLSQLQEAHIILVRYLDRLQIKFQKMQEVQQRQRQALVELQEEAEVGQAAMEGTRKLQETIDYLKRSYEENTSKEKAEMQQAVDHWRDNFLHSEKERLAIEHEKREVSEELRRVNELNEKLVADMKRQEEGLRKADQLINELQKEVSALQHESEKQKGDIFALQIELTMTQMKLIYLENEKSKLNLLLKSGYEWSHSQLATQLRIAQEEGKNWMVSHGRVETKVNEKEYQIRYAIEQLQPFLRLLWKDEGMELALLELEGVAAQDTATAKDNILTSEKPATRPLCPAELPLLVAAVVECYNHIREQQTDRQHRYEVLITHKDDLEHKLKVATLTENHLKKLIQNEKESKQSKWKDELEEIREIEDNFIEKMNQERSAALNASKQKETELEKQLQNLKDERNELKNQYARLYKDFIDLERKNGALHQKCIEKEYNNNKLEMKLRNYEPSYVLEQSAA